MGSVSEDDPYAGDDSDVDRDYRPEGFAESSSENSDGEPNLNKSRGKKRLRKPEEWKRNIQKERRTSGKEYVSTSKVVVPARVMGNACNCRLKCFDNVPADVRQRVFDDFNKLQSKELQDSYLCRNIVVNDVSRKRNGTDDVERNKPKSVTCKFSVKVGVNNFHVCKNALLAIHGIKKGRVDRLISHLKTSGTPPPDQRGRHDNRPNKITPETLAKIRDHILCFPRYKSHYSRSDNLCKYYLSPLLNIAKLHELYLQKHEPVQYALLQGNRKSEHFKENFRPMVQYEFFRKYFSENFNITFGNPKSDTCQKCDKMINQIDGADTEAERDRLKAEESLHVAKAQNFYEQLKAAVRLY